MMRFLMVSGLFLFLFLFTFALVPASRAETLSLRQAVILGMEHNYALRAAELDNERSEAGIVGARARFDITADLAAGAGGSETPIAASGLSDDVLKSNTSNAEAALSKRFASGLSASLGLETVRRDADSLADRLDPAYRTSLVLDLTQPLLKDRGTEVNTADLRIAQTRRGQAALGYLAQAQQLAADIELAYFNLAQAHEDSRSAALARDLAQELLAGNERKFEAGTIPVSEVNEAATAVAGREEEVLLAAQREILARNRLLALVDQGEAQMPQSWQVELPEPGPDSEPSLEEILATGLAQRPDLQQARLEITARKIALVYAENQRLPRLDLEASLGINGLSGDDGNGSRYGGDWQDSLSRAIDRDGSTWYAGLRFSLPLQNHAAQANWRDAVAQEKQALYRLYNDEISVEAAIRAAHGTLALGRERLEVARRFVVLARTTLDQENRRLLEGLSDTFRVLTFQNALITARQRQVAAQADYQRSLAALHLAAGTSLERYDIIAALPREGAMQ